jgi:hypothetical protein
MDGVAEVDDLVGLEPVHEPLVVGHESLLRSRVGLGRQALRLAVDEAQPVQELDRARLRIGDVEALLDQRDHRRRARKEARRQRPGQFGLLGARQLALATLPAEGPQRRHPVGGKARMPAAHSVVIEVEHPGDVLAAHPVVEQQDRIRPARHAVPLARAPHQRLEMRPSFLRQKTAANHRPSRIARRRNVNAVLRVVGESR